MIFYENKKYVCKLDFAMDFIRGKWKAVILCHLYDSPLRFLELQRRTKGISQKVLTEKLKELETSGLIDKKVYPDIPPKVEYFLTDKGESLTYILKKFEDWVDENFPELEGSCNSNN